MRDKFDGTGKVPLHYAFFKLMSAHRKIVHNEFTKIGLTGGQPKILDFLLENDGCIQREIAQSCRIEPATVTNLLANMEKAELIYRAENPKNRRILNVFLTDKGRKAQKQVDKVFNLIDSKSVEGFSEEEKLQTINILNKLADNLLKNELSEEE